MICIEVILQALYYETGIRNMTIIPVTNQNVFSINIFFIPTCIAAINVLSALNSGTSCVSVED